MLDLNYVVSNLEEVWSRLLTRGADKATGLDNIRMLAARRKELILENERLRQRLKASSDEMAAVAKTQGQVALGLAVQTSREQISAMKQQGMQTEKALQAVEDEIRNLLLGVPNIPDARVPVGKSEADNKTLRTWGEPRKFDFEPRDHVDVGEKLGILDFARAAKISGARFCVLKGAASRLERALLQFMLDLHTQRHGYTEVWPPVLINRDSMTATGQLPKFEADAFKTVEPEFFLAPTAEVPVTNLYRDEILDEAQLPVQLCAYTPCFRSEAGSYGKDTRGMIRQHQFDKVELVWFAHPEKSWEAHERLVAHAEQVLKELNLPYRVVALCTADIGAASACTYDLEVWLPSQKTYREISSCSNFTDYQARRGKIRFRGAGKGVKPKLLHTLNGSGLAIGRTLVAILENFQQADGAVVIPEVLRPYMGGMERITAG